MAMALQWFAVHTYSGHEQKAKKYLESAVATAGLGKKFGQVLVPTEQVTEMRQGKRSTSTKKFLPSYILVEMELDKITQDLVVSTPGITNFVGAGGKPQPLSDEEVNRILGQMNQARTAESTDVPFMAGDQVKVIDGPFSDFTGFVSEVNLERKKVKVMVSIFGRPTPVELDFLQVEMIKQKS
jgi:transcriptional antiterminator NusG